MFIHQVVNTYWKRRRYLKYAKHNEQRFIVRFGYIAFLLLVLVLVHTGAMMWLEGMVFGDALWLSVTTVTTVGYGDLSATTWEGRLVTTICLYAIAISLMAQLAGEFIDYRLLSQDRKTRGQWLWGDMKDHILIINTPDEDTVRYLSQLIEQIRITPDLEHYPIQILTRKFERRAA